MNFKFMYLFAVAAGMATIQNVDAENVITWETLGNNHYAASRTTYVQRFTVEADGLFERLALNALRYVVSLDPKDDPFKK